LVAAERVPVRERTELRDAQGNRVGEVTSGLPGPTIGKPVAMGYVPPAIASPGSRVTAMVRGKPVTMEVTALPFVPTRYHRA
jgi:aminomethyltransferase